MNQRPARAGRFIVARKGKGKAIDNNRNVPPEGEIVEGQVIAVSAPIDNVVVQDGEIVAVEDLSLWQRIVKTEPALLRGFVTAFLMLLVAFGVPVSADQKLAVIGFIGAGLALIQAYSTRQSVSPTDKVEALQVSAEEAIGLAYEAGATDAQLSGPQAPKFSGVA